MMKKIYISKSAYIIVRCITIKVKDIRALSNDSLQTTLNQLVLELNIEKRKTASTGVASKVVKTREIRRTIARINTILKERGAKV
jgi:ribosomal protein L29